jgi:hypothetical protein
VCHCGQRDPYFVKRGGLQALFKKTDYLVTAAVTTVWKMNPEIALFTNDLDYKLETDLECESSDVETIDVFDHVWYGVILPNCDKKGWLLA